jgi:DNA mismatch repair ATPase MutS
MEYHNILFPFGRPEEKVSEDLLKDLRIDSVLGKLSHGPDQLKYDTCYLPLTDKKSVLYRHEVFQDIMRSDLFTPLTQFQEMMDSLNDLEEMMRRLKLPVMRHRYFLNRMIEYKKNILFLLQALKEAPLKSRGLLQFLSDLEDYAHSEEFRRLSEETEQLKAELNGIGFQIEIKDNHIVIRKLTDESLYMEGTTEFEREIHGFFDQFISDEMKFVSNISDSWDLNPVEEMILNALMQIYPEPFSHLAHFFKKQHNFAPKELIAYHQDIGFYTVWLEYILPKQLEGLNFCFPMITSRRKEIMLSNCFDLVLADQMIQENQVVIRNNLVLSPEEHIMVLTGPNQGGKTTYARMIGQVFYLASLGILVPGSAVTLFLPDQIFTHFERQESQETLNGKLKDDIVRIHDILQKATENSLILINEMFSSTTLRDAAWLGKKIFNDIDRIGCLCLYVTFINELSTYLPGTVSLISQIGEDGEKRTYQIIRSGSDGKAYASSMVKKYALTYEAIQERIGSGR